MNMKFFVDDEDEVYKNWASQDFGTLYYSEKKKRYWVLHSDGSLEWINRFEKVKKGELPKNYNAKYLLIEYHSLHEQRLNDIETKEPKEMNE